MTPALANKGAAWLLEPGDAASVLTPERLSDEHRLIAQTARENERRVGLYTLVKDSFR